MLKGIKGNFPNLTSIEMDKNPQILHCDNSIMNCNRLDQQLNRELQDCKILWITSMQSQSSKFRNVIWSSCLLCKL